MEAIGSRCEGAEAGGGDRRRVVGWMSARVRNEAGCQATERAYDVLLCVNKGEKELTTAR